MPERAPATVPLCLTLLQALLPAALAGTVGAGCAVTVPAPAPMEATSLLGEALPRPLELDTPAKREAVELARRRWFAHPENEDAIVWYGRRLAYVGHYREAVAVFDHGRKLHPDSARLLRHRGHRFLTLRDLEAARDDLRAAARLLEGEPDALEPDGAPNAHGVPRSTLQGNVWYHLGLAHFFLGEPDEAARAFEQALERSRWNDDMLCASSYWLHLGLRRCGREAEARAVLEPIHAGMDVLENHAYHDALLHFKGELSWEEVAPPEGSLGLPAATRSFGLACARLSAGEVEEAQALFRRIVDEAPWPAFARLGAEAELARARAEAGPEAAAGAGSGT